MANPIEKRLVSLGGLSDEAARATGLKDKIYALLQASECLLIEAYAHGLQAIGRPLPQGLKCQSIEGGYVEFGPILYWLNNPPGGEIGEAVEAIVAALEVIELAPLPPSRISTAEYGNIKILAETAGIVAPDGTIYGESTYEQLDPWWLLALYFFLFYRVEGSHRFGTDPQVFPLAEKGGAITIAIVGDWGTGKYGDDGGPALAVMNDLVGVTPKPDYIVHLGDVYYAGTQGEEAFHEHLFSEEWDNLVNVWPDGYAGGTSFTLNSNHEMYDGAHGYFKVALKSGSPFAHQKKTSYFALTYGDWVVLGLDSAYYAEPDSLYMNGSLGGAAHPAQAQWVKDNFGGRKCKNVVVLTHHNGLDYTGENLQPPLWTEVCDAVGGDGPAYWYWGHIHDGIVYTDKSAAGSAVRVRCVGHGAIPFGKAWGLEPLPNPRVAYFAHTPIDGEVKVRNGFATITLTADGGITERFYETTETPGRPSLVWSSGA